MTTMVLPYLSGILATTVDGTIGYDDVMPWSHKGDLKRFFRLTKGQALMIGARTLIGAAKNYFPEGSEVFPGRRLIVVGEPRNDRFSGLRDEITKTIESLGRKVTDIHAITPSVSPLYDIYEAYEMIGDRTLFISGGANVFGRYLEFVSALYLTIISTALPDPGESRVVRLFPSTSGFILDDDHWDDIVSEGSDTDGATEAKFITMRRFDRRD